ncbi:interleukin-1 receptor-like 1 [Dendrobates tinctorius]|uniref:interleukin-1 receptor-like 1 n=1 Tax=Dendrobates tinctorius TaxID=92724 RepID=UPI003CCA5185
MELLCRFALLASLFSFSSSKINKANEGEAYVIECTEYRSIKINATWYRKTDSQPISSNKSDRVHSTGNNLWFLPTSLNDTGIYLCFLMYQNSNYSFEITLKIYPKLCPSQALYGPLQFSSPSFHVACPYIDLYDNKTTIIWYKDCKPIKGNHKTVQNDIIVSNATSYAGFYTCTFNYVHNGKEYNVTRTRRVQIVEKTRMVEPKFYTPFHNITEAELGTSINLSCSALVCFTCKDFYFVNWTINNTAVTNGSRFIQVIREYHSTEEISVEAILTIVKVQKEDYNSNFTCIAGNDKGIIARFVVLKPIAFNNTHNIIVVFVCLGILCCLLCACNTRLKIDLVLLFRDIFKSYRARNDGKDYDAYVIYSRSCHEQVLDNPVEYFVNNVLLEVLEHKCGYDLFLPERNTVPGEDVAYSSTENIEKSRRLIVILSSHVKSLDSLYDQQVGLHNALLSNNIKMIIIAMGDIDEETEMQESLRYIIKQNGIIKWEEKSKNNMSPNSRFWKLVRYQMPGNYGNRL